MIKFLQISLVSLLLLLLPLNGCAKKKLTLVGQGSWYGKKFHGRQTASGEKYNMYALTAAHKTLPFNTLVRVTNLSNKRSITVRINDRGPYARGRIIDLSYAAAKKLGYMSKGVTKLRIKVIGKKK